MLFSFNRKRGGGNICMSMRCDHLFLCIGYGGASARAWDGWTYNIYKLLITKKMFVWCMRVCVCVLLWGWSRYFYSEASRFDCDLKGLKLVEWVLFSYQWLSVKKKRRIVGKTQMDDEVSLRPMQWLYFYCARSRACKICSIFIAQSERGNNGVKIVIMKS